MRGLVDELGGLDTAFDMVKKRAGIPAAEAVTIDVLPERTTILDMIMKRSSPEETMAAKMRLLMGRMPVEAWLRGGYLRLMPYWIEVK